MEILNIVKMTMKEMFMAEAEDIREEILTEVKEQPSLVPRKDGVMTPEMYAAGIKAAPKQIEVFIKALAEATGSGVLLIFDGPDPWDEKGKVCSYGFHAGKDQQGQNFSQAFPKFRETYLNPFTRFLKLAFPPDVWAAHVLGGNTTIAEKQNGGVEGMGEMDDEARPVEQEQAVEGKELSQTEDGQIDRVQTNRVQTNKGPANAELNGGGDHQKDPEMEANPEDNNPMPHSPRAPTPAPALPRMNGINLNPAEKNPQDNIVNTNKALDQVITQVDGLIAPESNTVKCPHPHPLAKVTPVEDSLVMTGGKD
ncbi:hypothetical protein ARMGADRAFT_1091284 [Armillaria gallica]|uniref:Uncharacterized protein n=1 Tax=Armillaria gallica TaxID=47427 RepID=A0A2H3CE94_ARMGA|nr:hypothetical protein ARMGADRAFT_1091284 [Armillaria gallica]